MALLRAKRCVRCSEVKPASDFQARSTHRDGLDSWCKACHVERGRVKERNCLDCGSPIRRTSQRCQTCSARRTAAIRPQTRKLAPIERMWLRVDKTPTGCWLWTGGVDTDGYGQIRYQRRNRRTHQVAYELLVGPVPDGLQLDHLCRVRRCVNPAHMEPVTARENLLRGETLAASNKAKTRCVRGHSFATARITKTGARVCRECAREDFWLRRGFDVAPPISRKSPVR